MKSVRTCQLAIALFVFVRCTSGDTSGATSEDASEQVPVSPECAAVLLVVGGGVVGTGVTAAITSTVLPMVLCSGGFCAAGVQAGSLAARWQSTMPLISSGSVFASLQSIAMSGVGAKTLVVGGALGAIGVHTFLKDVCERIDEVDPTSTAGLAIESSLQTLRGASNIYAGVKPHVDQVYEDIKPHVNQVYEGIKPHVNQVYEGIKPHVNQVYEGIKPHVNQVYEDIKPHVNQLYEDIKPRVNQVYEDIKPHVNQVYEDIKPQAIKFMDSTYQLANWFVTKTVESTSNFLEEVERRAEIRRKERLEEERKERLEKQREENLEL